MRLQELEEEIGKLSLQERSALAKRLIDGLQIYDADANETDIEREWTELSEERLAALEKGDAQETPYDDSLRRVRALLS